MFQKESLRKNEKPDLLLSNPRKQFVLVFKYTFSSTKPDSQNSPLNS